jgi:hypothetical protein
MEILTNARVFVAGKTGTGKTTLVKRALFPRYPRRIFWDVKVENHDLLPVCSLCTTPSELERALTAGKVSILYQPQDLSAEDFDLVCYLIYDQGNMTLFVDEVTAICDPSRITPGHKRS